MTEIPGMREAALVGHAGAHAIEMLAEQALVRGEDFSLDALGERAAIPSCSPRTVWWDLPEVSIAVEDSGDHAGPTRMLDLVAIVALVEGHWWWCAMGPKVGAPHPEETRDDAKLCTVREYAAAVRRRG